jgi:alkylation response protein AidB-like acyl-CoA dehydrogenase
MNKESHQKLQDAVRDLLPVLTARGSDIEAARRVPPDLLDQLKSAGVFRIFLPESHGGFGLDLRAGMDIIEALVHAETSAGWTVMIGSQTPHMFSLLPRARFDAIYAAGPDVIIAGAFNPQGEAHVVEGGYRVSGRWSFASGCEHADYLLANCVVMQDGRPRPGLAEGMPEVRAMVLPKRDVRIIDTWNALGLRGTGSHDFAADSAFCPDDWTFDIFQGAPAIPHPTFIAPVLHIFLHFAATAVGIAQGAIDDCVALVKSGKKRLYARTSLAESSPFHIHLGRADISVRAARALAWSMADELWAACSSDPAAAAALLPRVSATAAWVTETACEVVDTCYREGGGGAARDGSPLQRRFRDMHTFTQHAAMGEGWLGQAGALLLGQPTGFFT